MVLMNQRVKSLLCPRTKFKKQNKIKQGADFRRYGEIQFRKI